MDEAAAAKRREEAMRMVASLLPTAPSALSRKRTPSASAASAAPAKKRVFKTKRRRMATAAAAAPPSVDPLVGMSASAAVFLLGGSARGLVSAKPPTLPSPTTPSATPSTAPSATPSATPSTAVVPRKTKTWVLTAEQRLAVAAASRPDTETVPRVTMDFTQFMATHSAAGKKDLVAGTFHAHVASNLAELLEPAVHLMDKTLGPGLWRSGQRMPLVLIGGNDAVGKRALAAAVLRQLGFTPTEFQSDAVKDLDDQTPLLAQQVLCSTSMMSVVGGVGPPRRKSQDGSDDIVRQATIMEVTSFLEVKRGTGDKGYTGSQKKGAFEEWLEVKGKRIRQPIVFTCSSDCKGISRMKSMPHIKYIFLKEPDKNMLRRLVSTAVEGEIKRGAIARAQCAGHPCFHAWMERVVSQGVGGFSRVLMDTYYMLSLARVGKCREALQVRMDAASTADMASTVFDATSLVLNGDMDMFGCTRVAAQYPGTLLNRAWTNYPVHAARYDVLRRAEQRAPKAVKKEGDEDDNGFSSFAVPETFQVLDEGYQCLPGTDGPLTTAQGDLACMEALADMSDMFSWHDNASRRANAWSDPHVAAAFEGIALYGTGVVRKRGVPLPPAPHPHPPVPVAAPAPAPGVPCMVAPPLALKMPSLALMEEGSPGTTPRPRPLASGRGRVDEGAQTGLVARRSAPPRDLFGSVNPVFDASVVTPIVSKIFFAARDNLRLATREARMKGGCASGATVRRLTVAKLKTRETEATLRATAEAHGDDPDTALSRRALALVFSGGAPDDDGADGH